MERRGLWSSGVLGSEPLAVRDGQLIMKYYGLEYKVPFHMLVEGGRFYPSIIHMEYDVDVHGKVVLDVGAFTGDSALYFISRGASRVIAIEPVPEHFEILRLNAEDLPVMPINAAVGCEVPYIPELIGRGSYGIKEVIRSRKGKLNVPVLSLSDLAESNRPQVVKVDCEGCEHYLVNELAKLKEIGVETLIIELHPVPNKTAEELLNELAVLLGNPDKIIVRNARGGIKITASWNFKA